MVFAYFHEVAKIYSFITPLCKPTAPFERSSPKIYVVDSEAHIHEISNYAVKSKRFFFLGWKYAQNTKKGPKNRH